MKLVKIKIYFITYDVTRMMKNLNGNQMRLYTNSLLRFNYLAFISSHELIRDTIKKLP